MLLGIWENIEDLEAKLTLEELELILKANREREMRHNRFMAAIQGIDLDKASKSDTQARFDAVAARVEARKLGKSEDEYTMDILGIDVETDDED